MSRWELQIPDLEAEGNAAAIQALAKWGRVVTTIDGQGVIGEIEWSPDSSFEFTFRTPAPQVGRTVVERIQAAWRELRDR